ncbi:MAG TPA: alpha/beta fold hydrolase [Burkholderiaceae bacterium]|nr:alpha/beta fold hydrolase [Burkholderiaceae bacterium]
MTYTKEPIAFDSEGAILRGFLFRATKTGPILIMAPGFGALLGHSTLRFADGFASAGFNVLAFDNRGFGESDGLPRQEVDPVMQKRAYRDAISFAQTLSGIDPARVGLWGSSYSGGHVIEVAAIDRRVRCIVTQVPTISGHAQALRRTAPPNVAALLERFDADRHARYRGEAPATLPLISDDPARPCVSPGQEALDYYSIPGFVNEITLRSVELSRENEPGIYIARVSPTPMLMIVASQDAVTPTDLALAAYNQALEPKRLLIVDGGHFSPYSQHFEATSRAAIDWFDACLRR